MPDNTVRIYPSLAYADVGRAAEWLARVFGFELTLEIVGDEHAQAYAELRLGDGDAWIMLSSPNPVIPAYGERPGFYVYVRDHDIESHYARATAEGAEIEQALERTDYATREYIARDLEGNLWHFGTFRPGMGVG
jgi:uncharacterized glyoxalase superfamily protein PhnB